MTFFAQLSLLSIHSTIPKNRGLLTLIFSTIDLRSLDSTILNGNHTYIISRFEFRSSISPPTICIWVLILHSTLTIHLVPLHKIQDNATIAAIRRSMVEDLRRFSPAATSQARLSCHHRCYGSPNYCADWSCSIWEAKHVGLPPGISKPSRLLRDIDSSIVVVCNRVKVIMS